jgi:flagellar protein FlgJ
MSTLPLPPLSSSATAQTGLSPVAAANRARAAKAGRDFEAQFISQMFQHMTEGVKADSMFGGGSGEEMFRSLLTDEYAKLSANRPGGSGFGIAPAVERMILSTQEVT